MKEQHAIILFDGMCNFCNHSVSFIIRHDSHDRYRFAPLQSNTGQDYLEKFAIQKDVNSIVLIEGERWYVESTAALRICRDLDGLWKAFYPLLFIPKAIRDFCYRWFANKRYILFGKRDSCMVPTKKIKEKFLLDE
ncbi:DCC1-like thiol-disulfide oxidoreductase family protein [Fodinisporobacter ferrooxydans]|uniref:DCC1-like thiol-disulfide oxidoreductase family protein n=1 Tax=Fodinisporobacter ferrooxydans TaxID=2901836 RepID=A0ABY4CM05_9BACL|nr:DCC1-like thiol-disulfide oxidoreductase family protein [Alicyclobacillaceae bacterium MYW30-H2]